jgi:hypothetical protein
MMQLTGGSSGAYVFLQRQTAAAAVITFSNFPTGYRTLLFEGTCSSNAGNAVVVQFNNDAAANYAANRTDFNVGAVAHSNQGATATMYLGITGVGVEFTNIFRVYQPDFATRPKTINSWNFSSSNMRIASGQWNNATDEITSIKIFPTGGTWVGEMSLYGVVS